MAEEKPVKILYSNKWISLYDKDGYIYSHETRCQGKIIAVLPFRVHDENLLNVEFLLLKQSTPCWDDVPFLCSLTGGWEGGDPADDAVKELAEETGYKIDKDKLLELGWCYLSKSADTVVHLFGADLSDMEKLEPMEKEDENIYGHTWVTIKKLTKTKDALVHVMANRFSMKFFKAVKKADHEGEEATNQADHEGEEVTNQIEERIKTEAESFNFKN